jgi:hypothetical protein
MNRRTFRRLMVPVLVALVLSFYNCMRIFGNTAVRTVDIVSLVALGILIGAALCSIFIYLWTSRRMSR